jgi:hypothetical protein
MSEANMSFMYDNLERVRDRIAYYNPKPDARYRGDSGFNVEEENIAQKIRQYWADTTISNEEKLLGFEMDLADFDPRNTTFMELNRIALGLEALGIIDGTTGGVLTNIEIDYDSNGNQINKDKRVNVFETFDRSLEFLKGYIADGFDFANDTLIKLNAGITVMLALEARAQASRDARLVDTHA